MATISTVYDSKRGCGYRKGGGIYLMAGAFFHECGKLPIPLTICPCCSAGIKPSRGWTWVSAKLIMAAECSTPKKCGRCGPIGSLEDWEYRFGLLWIGEKFYKNPTEYMREARAQGISRRISAVPNDFSLEHTWILLAHRKAIQDPENPLADNEGFIPGIFSVFKPDRIEYVVKGNETEEELDALEKRGITLVKVEKAINQTVMELS